MRKKRARTAGLGALLFILSLLVYLAWMELPRGFTGTGYDPSWVYALNVYKQQGLEFGRDLIHVWGPQGYLFNPLPFHGHLLHAVILSLLLHAAFLAGVGVFAVREKAYGRAAVIILLGGIFFHGEVVREVSLITISLLYYFLDLRSPRSKFFILPAALAGFFFFTKFDVGIVLALLFAVYLVLAIRLHKETLKGVLLILMPFAAAFVVGWMMSFSSFSSFARWFGESLRLAQSYAETNSVNRPYSLPALGLGFIIILLLIVLGVFLIRKAGFKTALPWLSMTLLIIFYQFKHAFIRADEHALDFFRLPLLAAALSLLFISLRRAAVVLVLIVAVSTAGFFIIGRAGEVGGKTENVQFQWIKDLVHFARYQREARQKCEKNYAADGLTPEEKSAIAGKTVEFFPGGNITSLHGTGAGWRPSLFFQYFHVESTRGDRMNAAHLSGPEAAEFIFFDYKGMDTRHPLHLAPESFPAILDHYSFISSEGRRLLLQRCESRGFEKKYLGTIEGKWNERVAVPASENMIVAAIQTRKTIVGKVVKTLYRIPPVFIEVEGHPRHRFIPGTGPGGYLVSRLPKNALQLRFLLERGRIHPRCPQSRFFSLKQNDRFPYFGKRYRVDFYEILPPPKKKARAGNPGSKSPPEKQR